MISVDLYRGTPVKGIIVRKINRFVMECIVGGRHIRAYLPNTGSLEELTIYGTPVILDYNKEAPGKYKYKVLGVHKEKSYVFLDTIKTNKIALELVKNEYIAFSEGVKSVLTEKTNKNSRFDLYISFSDYSMYTEVKTCTLFGKEMAMFPDAVTVRGTKHVNELLEISKLTIDRGMILFLVMGGTLTFFLPNYHTDPVFTDTLLKAREKVEIKAMLINWTKNFSSIKSISSLGIPWKILEKENKDTGCYCLILELKESRKIKTGSLGNLLFRKGFYIYVGSAMKSMQARVNRHLRIRKNFHWHIDYLRNECTVVKVYQMRTPDKLECQFASRIGEICDNTVRSFGSSDCDCNSHLFWFAKNPIGSYNFHQIIEYFRIDRLSEKYQLTLTANG
ncbi:MAG: DNA/RNA nuclease SfsA [Chitinispirillia bacterium]|jgi:sugar fermentation stimulation protein A